MSQDFENSGVAVIENDAIVIRVPLAVLQAVLDGSLLVPYYQFKITDVQLFAKALVTELNNEAEDGTTLVHRMFDEALVAELDSGAEGVEELPNDEDGNELHR